MNRRKRTFQPSALSLEDRALTTVMTVGPMPLADVSAIRTATSSRPVVSGRLTGNYAAEGDDSRPSDRPWHFNVAGSGDLLGLGRVRMSGAIDFGGFLAPSVPSVRGTITLRNAQGSVTIRLTGGGGHGQVLEQRFALNASIVGGTGAYRNLRGIGSGRASFGPNTIFCITTPCPPKGALTLQLDLRRPVR